MSTVSRRFMLVPGLGALSGGLAWGAMAQPMMGQRMGGWHFADQSAYLAGVKAELGIAAEQEAVWKIYADAVTAAAQMQAMHQTMWEFMGTAIWEERRDMMNRNFQAHRQAFQTVPRRGSQGRGRP